jgi:hypothetical protein
LDISSSRPISRVKLQAVAIRMVIIGIIKIRSFMAAPFLGYRTIPLYAAVITPVWLECYDFATPGISLLHLIDMNIVRGRDKNNELGGMITGQEDGW